MTERELLQAKIRTLQLYLSMLTSDNWTDKEIGLPKGVSRMQEVDRVLDLILEYRSKLRKID
ncbi:MAG: hypothetical protein IPN76_12570 [Saprospiraceae bacterium]|nr:hypothetical protein [Saprospiraceae bacterium]